MQPSKKHLREAGVKLTSPAAFAISAAISKGTGVTFGPQSIAEKIAAKISLDPYHSVRVAGGHLNFSASGGSHSQGAATVRADNADRSMAILMSDSMPQPERVSSGANASTSTDAKVWLLTLLIYWGLQGNLAYP